MCSVVEMVRRYISACSEWDLERVSRRRLTARSLAAARAWARHGRRRRSATSGQAVSIASPTSRYLSLPRNPLSSGRLRTWWIILVIASSFDVAKPCAIVFRFSAEPTFSRSCSVTASSANVAPFRAIGSSVRASRGEGTTTSQPRQGGRAPPPIAISQRGARAWPLRQASSELESS